MYVPAGVPPPLTCLVLAPPQAICMLARHTTPVPRSNAKCRDFENFFRCGEVTSISPANGNNVANTTEKEARASMFGFVFAVRTAVLPGETDDALIPQVGAAVTVVDSEQLNDTELLNPLTAETLNVEVADCPALTETGLSGVASTEKSGGLSDVKVAVTVWSAVEVNVHLPAPAQLPPLQPVKLEPEAAVAVSVTDVPTGKVNTQFVFAVPGTSQSIPAGLLFTVPLPMPGVSTISCGSEAKVALTSLSESMSSTQVLDPEQSPVHDERWEVGCEALPLAVKVTVVPLENCAEQSSVSARQLIPAGELVTVSFPVDPFTVTFAMNNPAEEPPLNCC
jgi:hypothetical protein